jgi:glycerate kinase
LPFVKINCYLINGFQHEAVKIAIALFLDDLKILVVPDSFKESATSEAITRTIITAIKKVLPAAQCVGIPMADGGEGSLSTIHAVLGGVWQEALVNDPLGRPIHARWLRVEDVAYIELAEASGLQLLEDAEKLVMQTSTYGTGQQMQAAVAAGVKEIVLCIGGSATNDAGCGIAAALGCQFYDAEDHAFIPTGKQLEHVHRISYLSRAPVPVTVLCDVENPFTGPSGAVYTYATQKGATGTELKHLEAGMVHLQHLITDDRGIDLNAIAGAGAAGGVGGGMVAFLEARMVSGVDYLIRLLRVEEHMQRADLVITGEGKIDHQTGQGKLIAGILRIARKYNKPVAAVCGALQLSATEISDLGLIGAFSIQQKVQSWEDARRQTLPDLALCVEQIFNFSKSFLRG